MQSVGMRPCLAETDNRSFAEMTIRAGHDAEVEDEVRDLLERMEDPGVSKDSSDAALPCWRFMLRPDRSSSWRQGPTRGRLEAAEACTGPCGVDAVMCCGLRGCQATQRPRGALALAGVLTSASPTNSRQHPTSLFATITSCHQQQPGIHF